MKISISRLLLCALTLSVFTLACHRTKMSGAPNAKHFHFTGRIISLDAQQQSALIDGDNIPGFMDAMAMTYKIKPASTLGQLAPGDSISGDLVEIEPADSNSAPEYWLENVQVTAHGKAPGPAPTSQRIPAPGDEVPDFHLVNQDGKHVSLRQYRGKILLLTFIYTRCPFPDFCPRVINNFAEIDKQLSSDRGLAGRAHLLSVSFDPEHDTPKALRDYAYSVAHTHDATLFKRWEFAVPRAADLPKMADFFALTYKPEGGLITHNLSTTVIGPEGKIVKWYYGSDWQASDLMKDVANAKSNNVAAGRS